MLTEVMESYGLVKEFRQSGYYETVEQQQLFKDIIAAISRGATRFCGVKLKKVWLCCKGMILRACYYR